MNALSKDQFEKYLTLLLKWNAQMNLTAITDPDEIRSHHFYDSTAPVPFVKHAKSLVDLGTGAGFPGIPLKIMMPDLKVVLIDAKRKKISFCSQVIRALELKDIEALQGRAEDPYLFRTIVPFDVVISRATWDLGVFLEIADPYFDENGICIAMRGAKWNEELESSKGIVARHNLHLDTAHPYTIGTNEKRCLLIFKKRN